VQKGFKGLATNARIEAGRMGPCLEIWQRTSRVNRKLLE